jgi:GNAT superfamily N-acetyltransferase
VNLRIETRSGTADEAAFLDRFADVPGQLRRDPYRHVNLPLDRERMLCGLPWPAPVEMWLATDRDRVIARLGANVSPTYRDAIFFGFFEFDVEQPDGAWSLLEHMIEWARARGARKAYGPINFTTWFPYRLRTDRNEPPPFSWEPDNPPEYVTLLERAGFAVASRYSSAAQRDATTFAESNRSGWERARAAGFSVRSFDGEIRPQDLQSLHSLVLQSYQDNFLFEPIDFATFAKLYLAGTSSKQRLGSNFIVDPKGKDAGFLYSFRDGDFVVTKTVAVLPTLRGHGLSRALFHLSGLKAVEQGLGMYPPLINDGVGSVYLFACAPVAWNHTFAVFGRDLT